jgi:hypothetical protein
MTRTASLSPLGTEFDSFLFAPLSEDRDEMPLSVLSALARLDVDPWEEAAKLAQLPPASAIERLVSLLAALPHGPSARLDAGRVSPRLIALLPQRASSNIPSRDTLLNGSAVTNARVVMFLVIVAFMLGVQCITASRQTPVQIHNDQMSPSGTVFPHIPPPSYSR